MTTDKNTRLAVVPCSGIGKAFGSVAREAGYDLCDDVRPANTRLVALSKLVLGEEQAKAQVCAAPAMTIDGCKAMCAAKLVKLSGGSTAHEVVVIDAFRRHKELKPEGIAELNAAGKQLARVIAEEMAKVVDEVCQGTKGADHG